MRRMAVGSMAAALIVLLLAGCGGSEASPSASVVPSEAPAATMTAPAVTTAPTVEPDASASTAATIRMTALCAGVGVRKDAATDAPLVVRLPKGATVRVVETVTGDPYEAGSCGAAGDDWLKIDRINGKTTKSLYGVPYGYAAGGFFK